MANKFPPLPCHSWGTSLFLLKTRSSVTDLHREVLPLGAYQALAHRALQGVPAEECQGCLLPWRAEFGKPPSDGCPPAARMEEMWGWDYHGLTSATTPLCWSLEQVQWVLCPCHTWGWTTWAQPCRKCWPHSVSVQVPERGLQAHYDISDTSAGRDGCYWCPLH